MSDGAPPDFEGLTDRIREVVDRFETRAQAAEVAGISTQQLYNLVSGRNKPSLIPMARLVAAVGESMDWLVTGARPAEGGTKKTGDQGRISHTNNSVHPSLLPRRQGEDALRRQALLARVIEAIASVYRDADVELTPVNLGRIAALEYDLILSVASSPAEERALIRVAGERLRRSLGAARP